MIFRNTLLVIVLLSMELSARKSKEAHLFGMARFVVALFGVAHFGADLFG